MYCTINTSEDILWFQWLVLFKEGKVAFSRVLRRAHMSSLHQRLPADPFEAFLCDASLTFRALWALKAYLDAFDDGSPIRHVFSGADRHDQ